METPCHGNINPYQWSDDLQKYWQFTQALTESCATEAAAPTPLPGLRWVRSVRRVVREWKRGWTMKLYNTDQAKHNCKRLTHGQGKHSAKKQRRSTTSQATSNLGNVHWSQGHVKMTQAKHAVRTTTGGKATCWVKPQVKLGTHYLSWVHLFSKVFTLWRIFFVL